MTHTADAVVGVAVKIAVAPTLTPDKACSLVRKR